MIVSSFNKKLSTRKRNTSVKKLYLNTEMFKIHLTRKYICVHKSVVEVVQSKRKSDRLLLEGAKINIDFKLKKMEEGERKQKTGHCHPKVVEKCAQCLGLLASSPTASSEECRGQVWCKSVKKVQKNKCS